jgi:LCP family protein required for cell wall assembly
MRRRRRAVAGGAGAAVLAAAGVAGVVGYDARRLGDVQKVQVAALAPATGSSQVILVVGSDGSAGRGSPSAGADSVAFVRIDGAAHTASVLPVPRDLLVPGPQGSGQQKVSHVFRTGGAPALATALQAALGVQAQRYVELDMDGFRALVDAVGGVRMQSDVGLRDTRSGLAMSAGACETLDGTASLALARSRSLEVIVAGRTVSGDGTGDLGRMQRGSVLSIGLLTSLRSVGADPVALHRLVGAFADHAVVDSGTSEGELFDLANDARSVDPGAVTVAWLPVRVQATPPEGPVSLELAPGWEAARAAFEQGVALAPVPPLPVPAPTGLPSSGELPTAPSLVAVQPC